MRRVAVACGLAITGSMLLAAQQSAPKPAFEVATVKPNLSKSGDASMRVDPGGRFRSVNAPVFLLIAAAYGGVQGPLRPSQIAGAPGWLESERYDINAKTADSMALPIDATVVTVRPLLQSLLEDRFKLRVHLETRQLPVYALVRVKPDGPLGPAFGPSSIDCAKEPAKCVFRGGPGRVKGTVTNEALMQLMALATGSVVIDRTGLAGPFDIELEWSPDQTATDRPSIFAAVQEQLGLKLESTRGPVDVVVIDHVEKPTED